ncbi:MAG: HlyD family efflux transporter periplasmic adaptor subunit [Lysobacter sp.]|nr:HlyD family efflux transporter periplasmic adaptor subunit [Lysobacter sp.]
MKHRARALLSVPLLASLLAACGHGDRTAPARVLPPPPGVVARGQVDIQGGTLALGLPVDGTVAEVGVVEGASVHRGQPLLQADPTPARLEETLAEAKLAQAQAQVGLLQPKVGAAALRAQRLEEAARNGAGDGQSADDAREAASETRAELTNAQAGVRLARAELEHARYQVRQQVLRAPVDGQVLRVATWPGMRAAAGAPLLTLLPAGARIVRAELSQDALAQVSPGEVAQVLSDDGRQTPLARARVLRVGPVFGQSVLQADPMQRVNERSVECVLALEPPDTGLRVGQRVLVRFERPAAAKGR